MNQSHTFIHQVQVGPLQNFIYFIGDKSTHEVALVDPAWDVDFLRKEASRLKLKIVSVFLTHGHPDHVNGLPALLATHDVPVYISQHEASFYKPRHKNIVEVGDRHILTIGKTQWECLHTPGHTPGCQCFLSEGNLIAGDTLFVDGCGRCDLPGGSARVMYHSLYNILLKLPDSTMIYPGHNYGAVPCDTLANQKRTNPYLQCKSLNEFLSERMGISL